MSSSLCHVRHCPPFLVASVPLDAISDYSSLYAFLSFFSLFFSFLFFQIFCSSLPLLFFRGPSFAFENFCLSRNLTRPPLILFFNARAIRSFFPIFFAPNEANVIEPINYRWI
jgi:hypothetical protein